MEHIDWLKSVGLPYANFIIFFLLAVRFLKKPLSSFSETRKQRFDNLMAEANSVADRARTDAKQIEAKLEIIDTEIASLKKEIMDSANLESKNIIESAKMLAEHIKAEAKRAADVEVTNAKHALEEEIIRMATKQVSAKLREELKQKDKQLNILHSKVDLLEKANLTT